MTVFKISYGIDGMESVLRDKTMEVKISDVTFEFRDNERVGTVTIESSELDSQSVEIAALYMIDSALSKACFCYYTEGSLRPESLYVTDLTNRPNLTRVRGSLVLRSGRLKEDSKVTLSKMDSLPEPKKKVLDLALRYYKLSHIKNPVRIVTLFSSISTLVRDMLDLDENLILRTEDLKDEVKTILSKLPKFNVNEFENNSDRCYKQERNPIGHGRESKLADPGNLGEYHRLAGMVASWTRYVVYYYIDISQLDINNETSYQNSTEQAQI